MITLFEYFPSLPNNIKVFVGLTVMFTASFIVDVAVKNRLLQHAVAWLICEVILVILLFFVFPAFRV